MWYWRRAQDILKDHGPLELIQRTRRYVKERHTPSYQQKRVDNEFRWEFIQPHVEEAKTAIDVGCAQGFLLIN